MQRLLRFSFSCAKRGISPNTRSWRPCSIARCVNEFSAPPPARLSSQRSTPRWMSFINRSSRLALRHPGILQSTAPARSPAWCFTGWCAIANPEWKMADGDYSCGRTTNWSLCAHSTMKTKNMLRLIAALALGVAATPLFATTLSVPSDSPAFAVDIPADWKPKTDKEDKSVEATEPGDHVYMCGWVVP